MWLLLLACRPLVEVVPRDGPQVRYSPVPEPEGEAAELVLRVPEATWDLGLARAARLLVAQSQDRRGHLSVRAVSNAQGIAGYPGQASFAKEVNGGGFPEHLAEELSRFALSSEHPVDVGLAWRDYGDGLRLWIGGIARRPLLLDPMPRDLVLDQPLAVFLETKRQGLLLFMATPNQTVEVMEPSGNVALWVDRFHVPGAYTFEVVDPGEGEVLSLWRTYVEQEPDPVPALVPLSEAYPDPIAAAEHLYASLNDLRVEAGLGALKRFDNFEPLAREHAALMAHAGVVGHSLPGAPGVAARAQRDFIPLARHHEDVAVGYSWDEALELVQNSPGHLRNLLCEPCTHVSIGVALEPTLKARPRLFVVWELLEFPSGLPERKPW